MTSNYDDFHLRACPYPCFLVEVAPFDEIVANPSDLKHVVELSRSTDGLGAVVTVVLYHFCVFYMRFPNSAKWFGTEVGTISVTLPVTNAGTMLYGP